MSQPHSILCPRCRKPGHRQARFCRHCGHDLRRAGCANVVPILDDAQLARDRSVRFTLVTPQGR